MYASFETTNLVSITKHDHPRSNGAVLIYIPAKLIKLLGNPERIFFSKDRLLIKDYDKAGSYKLTKGSFTYSHLDSHDLIGKYEWEETKEGIQLFKIEK